LFHYFRVAAPVKFRRQKRQQENLNLTALIDVLFLLLIFVMASTTFTRESRLQVELPEAEGSVQTEQKNDIIEILVDKDGSYAVNGNLLVNRKIDTVMAALQQVAGTDLEQPIIIVADADAPHRAVVTVMDAAGRLGFTKLNISTQEPQEQKD
jgi:biopolymer transport protein ExbD